MKERPIIFSDEMVSAILEGRKSQTRRVAKLNGDRCHFGQVGDWLWVKETWAESVPDAQWGDMNGGGEPTPIYRADNRWDGVTWRSPIFMPRYESRITLEIVSVRVERVQDISEADAIAEGIDEWEEMFRCGTDSDPCWTRDARLAYAWLWDSINAKRGFGWDTNPWVWVVEFKPARAARK